MSYRPFLFFYSFISNRIHFTKLFWGFDENHLKELFVRSNYDFNLRKSHRKIPFVARVFPFFCAVENPSLTFFALNNLIISTYFSPPFHKMFRFAPCIISASISRHFHFTVYLMAFIQYLMLHIQHKYYSKWLWVGTTTEKISMAFIRSTKHHSLRHSIQFLHILIWQERRRKLEQRGWKIKLK